MNPDFVRFLVDPKTREPLSLVVTSEIEGRVVEGKLCSPTNEYPIVNGIPRFEAGDYASSFGKQWARWPKLQFDSENEGKPMEGHTTKMWDSITRFEGTPSEGEVVVDMGCGSGRFVEVARKRGFKVIAIDYSSAVEQTAEAFRDDPDVLVCQASALELPIAEGVIDGAYSIGVLHHTPDPEAGVKEAFRVLKTDGWFGLNVYYQGGSYDLPMVTVLRKFFNFVKPVFGYAPALFYSYCAAWISRPLCRLIRPLYPLFFRQVLPFMLLPDWKWTVLDTFDSVTPSYQSTHKTREVFEWFRDAGFEGLEPTWWSSASFAGFKRS
jgi:ubiquinone/menaquinone biosynthesis C-methylase UbiE/uncharacterized protein YbaR (Trm112 family)